MKEISRDERVLIHRWIIQTGVFILGYLPLLLCAAGDVGWLWGWLYWVVLTVFLVLHPILLIPINPHLLAERARGTQTEGTKNWDKILTMVGPGLMPFVSQFISFFDHRYSWTTTSIFVRITSLSFTIIGYGIFLWAMVTNGFFAEGVRIQTERGHSVCDSGPYQYVRHPGYAGSILAILGTPLILDSYWGIIPALLGVILIIVRTMLEDQTLLNELDGYRGYTERVKYRLLPGVF